MNEVKLIVNGMTCGSCVGKVTNTLKSLDDIKNVAVDLASGKVKVTRSNDKASDLIQALTENGYPAEIDTGSPTKTVKESGCGGGCSCS